MLRFLGSERDVTGINAGLEGKGKEQEPEKEEQESKPFAGPHLSAPTLPNHYDSPPQTHAPLPQQDFSRSQPQFPTQQSSSTVPSPSPESSGLRVPTMHPYWYHHHHSASNSSQSSLESPITPSNIAWISNGSSSSLVGSSQRQATRDAQIGAPSISRSKSLPSSPPPDLYPPASCPAPTLKASYFPPPPSSSPSTPTPPVSLPPTSSPLAVVGRPKLYAHAPGVSGYAYASSSKSSYALRLPGQEDVFPAPHGPLSPIVEQDYLSPEKRPVSLPNTSSSNSPCTPTMVTPVSQLLPPTSIVVISPSTSSTTTPVLTPVSPTSPTKRRSFLPSPLPLRDTKKEDSPRPSPIFSSFISRPLNRSLSLSSTRTHTSGSNRTPTSATAPIIPPLDLRPSFQGPMPLRTPTRGSSLGSSRDPTSPLSSSFKDSPTVLHREPQFLRELFVPPSPAVDDASSLRPDSFMTARSIQLNGDGKTNRDSVLPDSVKPLELDIEREYPHEILQYVEEVPRIRSPSHSSSCPPSYTLPGVSTQEFQPNKSLASIPVPDLRSTSTTSLAHSVASASSSFIDRRFESFNDSAPAFHRMRKLKGNGKGAPSMTCIMFWLGFVAPWCWLIGGWLLGAIASRSGRGSAWGGSTKTLLPLWTEGKSTVALKSKSTLFYNGFPFFAPSVASLTPLPQSSAGLSSMPALIKPKAKLTVVDPWVKRCRVAAVASGFIIAVAFAVALAAAGHA